MTHAPQRRALVLFLALVGLPALAQDGDAPPSDGGSGPLAPTPLTVQVEPTPAPARDLDPAAVAILDAGKAAMEALDSFRATVTCTGAGVFKDTTERGSVQLIGRRAPDDRERWQLRISGSIQPERGPEPIAIDATFDGRRMRYVDPEEKVIGARILPVRINRNWFSAPQGLVEERVWIHKYPSEILDNATRLSVEKRETIGGVECDVVRADMAGGAGYHLMAFGVEDHLPRRFVLGIDSRNLSQSLPMTGFERTDYERMEVNPPLSDADFVIAVPEGWREDKFPDQIVATPTIAHGATAQNNLPGMGRFENSGEEGATAEDGSITISGDEDSSEEPVFAPVLVAAQDFELKDPAGATVRLNTLRGQRVVVLFWGSWNPWARELLTQVAPTVGQGQRLLVLSVRERSREAAIQRFEQQGSPGTLLLDADETAAKYEVGAVPTILVIDEAGRVVMRETGFAAGTELVERVGAALAGQ